jgi:NADH:ubiquinone oxidoreductase subunit K
MKDIVFTAKRQRTELIVFGVCLLVSFLMNVYAIVAFNTEWKELYTQLLWVLAIAVFLYAVSVGIRLIYTCVRSVLKSNKK